VRWHTQRDGQVSCRYRMRALSRANEDLRSVGIFDGRCGPDSYEDSVARAQVRIAPVFAAADPPRPQAI